MIIIPTSFFTYSLLQASPTPSSIYSHKLCQLTSKIESPCKMTEGGYWSHEIIANIGEQNREQFFSPSLIHFWFDYTSYFGFQLQQLQRTLSRVIAIIALAGHDTFATYARLLGRSIDHMRQLAISASEMLSQAIATILLANYTSFVTNARWLK